MKTVKWGIMGCGGIANRKHVLHEKLITSNETLAVIPTMDKIRRQCKLKSPNE